MPFISTKTTVSISAQQEESLVRAYGKALPLIGKSKPTLCWIFRTTAVCIWQEKTTSPLFL